MNTISVPYNGKGYKIKYSEEMIDMSMTTIPFLNVYSVFVEDEELKNIVGGTFHHLAPPNANRNAIIRYTNTRQY